MEAAVAGVPWEKGSSPALAQPPEQEGCEEGRPDAACRNEDRGRKARVRGRPDGL